MLGRDADYGHEQGTKNAEKIVDYARRLGVKYLTLYTLSTENWRERSKKEVKGIFDLLVNIVRSKKEEYRNRGIKLFVLGNFQAFPRRVVRAIEEMLKIVLRHERMRVNVALNYGGRDEIVMAIKKIIEKKIPADKINEETVSQHLYTNGQPDPDLIIRTGGQLRLSNFLIWQMSYAELYFTDVLWPDFGSHEFDKAIAEYQKRARNFGK